MITYFIINIKITVKHEIILYYHQTNFECLESCKNVLDKHKFALPTTTSSHLVCLNVCESPNICYIPSDNLCKAKQEVEVLIFKWKSCICSYSLKNNSKIIIEGDKKKKYGW